MSSQKVRKLSKVLDFTSTWDTGLLTVITSANHNLVTGDKVNLISQDSPQELINVTVTVVDATTFTIQSANKIYRGKMTKYFFREGDTGKVIFSAPRATGASCVIQSFVTGTTGASYNLEASLDGVHWVSLSTLTHALVDGDSEFSTVEPSWAYFATDITAIGAGTKLEILYSA